MILYLIASLALGHAAPSCSPRIVGPPLGRTAVERLARVGARSPEVITHLFRRVHNPAHQFPRSVRDELLVEGIATPDGFIEDIYLAQVGRAMFDAGDRMVVGPHLENDLRAHYLRVEAVIDAIHDVYRRHFIMLRASDAPVNPAGARGLFTNQIVLRFVNDVPVTVVTPLGELEISSREPDASPAARLTAREALAERFGLHIHHGVGGNATYALFRDAAGSSVPLTTPGVPDWTFGPRAALELWSRVRPPHRR